MLSQELSNNRNSPLLREGNELKGIEQSFNTVNSDSGSRSDNELRDIEHSVNTANSNSESRPGNELRDIAQSFNTVTSDSESRPSGSGIMEEQKTSKFYFIITQEFNDQLDFHILSY